MTETNEARDRARDAARRVKAEKMASWLAREYGAVMVIDADVVSGGVRTYSATKWADVAEQAGCNPPSSDETLDLVLAMLRVAEQAVSAAKAAL